MGGAANLISFRSLCFSSSVTENRDKIVNPSPTLTACLTASVEPTEPIGSIGHVGYLGPLSEEKSCTELYNKSNNKSNPNLHKVAWVRRIGFAMIKSIEIEINDTVIDRHYGEWLHIWSLLTTRNIDDGGLDKLIGNVPELTFHKWKRRISFIYSTSILVLQGIWIKLTCYLFKIFRYKNKC